MKMVCTITAIIALAALSASAGQNGLSGTIQAYYFNTMVPGCLVKLRPESPTAMADSTVSDANGKYSFPNVSPGVYTILVIHPDYLRDSQYVAVDDQITSDFELLKKANVYMNDLPDTLKKGQSPVIVGRGMEVDHSLFIHPGVAMILLGYLTIRGPRLIAQGSKNDSITIASRSMNAGVLAYSPLQRYRHCVVKGVSKFHIERDSLINTFFEFDSCRISDSVNFYYQAEGDSSSMSSTVMQDNIFENCGINLMCDTLIFKRNVVKMKDQSNISIGIFSKGNIASNNFYCQSSFDLGSSNDTIINNIFSTGFVYINKNTASPVFFAYNDVLYLGTIFPGIGTPIIRNDNGEPCDLFMNIFSDPRIADSLTGRLSVNSPCIRAGLNGVNIGVWQGTDPSFALKNDRRGIPSGALFRPEIYTSVSIGKGPEAQPSNYPVNVYSLNGKRLSMSAGYSLPTGNGASFSSPKGAAGLYVIQRRR
jgi:hypothetical protein